MRIGLLLAALVALSRDECGPDKTPVRSLHSLTPDSVSSCEEALRGTWQPAGTKDSSVVWIIETRDTSCDDSYLELLVLDTSFAAIVMDSARAAMLDPDSAIKARLKKDKKLRRQYNHDTTIVSRVLSRDTLKTYMISTFRDSAGLYMDISLEHPARAILGGEFIETHWLLRADASADSLRLIPFSNHWLTTAMDSGRISTPRFHDGSGYVLSGRSDELQGLLKVAEGDTAAFPVESGTTFTRRHKPDATTRR
jgi:hypothetical protein